MRDFGSFSGDIKAHEDIVLDDHALPTTSGSVVSDPFPFGQAPGLELVVQAEVTVPQNKTLTLEFLHDDSTSGSFANSVPLETLLGGSGTAGTTFSGDVCRYASVSGLGLYGKIKATADADLSAGTITAYLHQIPR